MRTPAKLLMVFSLALSLAGLTASCGSSEETTEGGGGTNNTGGSAGSQNADDGGLDNDGSIVGTPDGASDVSFEGCVATGEIAKNTRQPADIIFAVDNTPSMRDEIVWTQKNLNKFSAAIAKEGLDPHIVMLSCLPGDCGGHPNSFGICVAPPLGKAGGCPDGGPYGDTNPPSYLHIDIRIPSTKGLQRISETYDQWKSMLRSTATTHFVIISDDGDDWSSKQFLDDMKGKNPSLTNFKVHGIFSYLGKEDACAVSKSDPCCQYGSPDGEGKTYKELVKATGGISGNLCEQNFDPIFDQFATDVIASAKLNCEWAIPAPPDGKSLNPNLVNVEFIDGDGNRTRYGRVDSLADCSKVADGWYYDNPTSPTKVLVCPSTCSSIQGHPGAKIDVQFGCATEVAPTK